MVGVAPTSGLLSPPERAVILHAIDRGLDVVNGLHEFLNDDPEFAAAATLHNVEIHDVRRPRAKTDLRMFSGRIATVDCPRIAVLGTDGAIGKRTTATILTQALNDRGIKAVLVVWALFALLCLPVLVFRMVAQRGPLYVYLALLAAAALNFTVTYFNPGLWFPAWLLAAVIAIQLLQTGGQALADYGLRKMRSAPNSAL